MRQYKFRAWHRKLKIMSDPFNPLKSAYSIDFRNTPYDNQELSSFRHLEIMQYTGLKDKSGKEIYEGDIIRWTDVASKTHTTTVSYSDEYACFSIPLNVKIEGDIEVIGNVHEDPELLENN